jgi:protein SCO1/2
VRTKLATLSLLALVLGTSSVSAHPSADGADEILPPPPTYKGNDVAVVEQLGAHVPLDARFRTTDGKLVVLGDLLGGDLPVILTFNYSDCPMLCSLQLNGLVNVIPQLASGNPKPALLLGVQYKIITIDLEPNESIEKLGKMRERYLERIPKEQRDNARAGWTFLSASGDPAAIRRVADAVGFKYTYIPERAEWAHPAALIMLSSAGAVTRYVYGIEFDPLIARESILKAGQSEPATAVGFLNRCYHYDPDATSHAHAGVVAMRIGAAGFIVLMISAFGLMRFLKKHRRSAGEPS